MSTHGRGSKKLSMFLGSMLMSMCLLATLTLHCTGFFGHFVTSCIAQIQKIFSCFFWARVTKVAHVTKLRWRLDTMKGSWESYEASKLVGGAENAPPVQSRVKSFYRIWLDFQLSSSVFSDTFISRMFDKMSYSVKINVCTLAWRILSRFYT